MKTHKKTHHLEGKMLNDRLFLGLVFRNCSSPTRNPPISFPLKILKKANLKRTHKEATLKTRNFEKGEVVVIWFRRLKMVLS